MYDYRIKGLTEEENIDYSTYLERHLKILKSHGVNAANVYDARIGQQIASKESQYTVESVPVSGTLVFIGDKDEAQMLQKLLH